MIITDDDTTTEVNGRTAGIIRCLLNGQTEKGVPLSKLLEIDSPVRFKGHCGRDDNDVSLEVTVIVKALT